MKILIADKFPDERRQQLIELGHEVNNQPGLGAEDLPTAIADNEVLIVRSTEVSRTTLSAGTELKLIIRAGAGTNTIDKAAAKEMGKHVCNCPGTNSVAVAELVMGLMLAVDRRIPQNTAALKAGEWNKKEFSKADGIKGKTLGIAGVGAIGKELAKRALAFDMKIIAYDVVPFDLEGVSAVETIEDLFKQADVLSLHVPLNDATKHLVNAERLSLLKDSAILINASRGGVIDEAALVEAVKQRGLRVALDVYEQEPAAGDNHYSGEIAKLDTVIGTHHIGASTQQAQLAVADEVLNIITDYKKNGSFRNDVTGY